MKIVIFRTDPSILNVGTYNSQEIGLAKAYIELGHECDIIYYNGNNDSYEQEIELGDNKKITIYWRKGFSIFNNGFFPGISEILEKYDMIQVSEYYQFASWWVYTSFKHKKVYVYQGVYDSTFNKRFNLRCLFMDPLLLNKSVKDNTIVFTKSILAEESMRRRGFQNVQTVGVGLDVSRLDSQNNLTNDWPTKDKDDFFITYVGVLEDRRNILFIIELFSEIVKVKPFVKLVLVGNGKEDYKSKVLKTVNDLGLSDKVLYKEKIDQDNIGSIYKKSDLFLLPTKYEIFGMVILESMKYGVPVITTYNGGSSFLLNDKNGVIIDNNSIDDWKNAIISIIEDNDLRVSLSENAKKTLDVIPNWKSIASAIIEKMEGGNDEYIK